MPAPNQRIALLGDVHANLPALEAVISHATSLGVKEFWNIGDFVGYGAYPDQVVERLRTKEFVSIAGNYDLKVLKFPKKTAKWRKNKHPLKWLAFKWAYENLSKKSRKFLGSLPEERALSIGERRFLLVHGSPASNEEPLEPDTPEHRLRILKQLAEDGYGTEFEAIIFGHSHQGFTRQVGKTTFINTGSVGRPDDGNPRTAYALLQLGTRGMQIFHYRLNYEINRAVAEIRARGLPEPFAEMLIQGRDLETILSRRF
jgi:predicted phosphodiesterase